MDGRVIHRGRAHAVPRRPPQEPEQEPEPLDLQPRSVYEVLTRQMLDALTSDVQKMRERVDALFFLVIASTLVDLLLRLAGRG